VKRRATALGFGSSGLHDRVRDERDAGCPDTLSTGSAAGFSGLMAAMARGELVSGAVSERLRGWLSLNADTSMVASAFGLDPLEHADPALTDLAVTLVNKTGSDRGIRADVGWVALGDHDHGDGVAYAAIANWDPDREHAETEVLRGMRMLGRGVRDHLRVAAAFGR
jgi:beta-lactamase class A